MKLKYARGEPNHKAVAHTWDPSVQEQLHVKAEQLNFQRNSWDTRNSGGTVQLGSANPPGFGTLSQNLLWDTIFWFSL